MERREAQGITAGFVDVDEGIDGLMFIMCYEVMILWGLWRKELRGDCVDLESSDRLGM